jgi:hypothetical protein
MEQIKLKRTALPFLSMTSPDQELAGIYRSPQQLSRMAPTRLANDALTITGVTSGCDGGDCTNPTNSIGISLYVPADAVAPAAGKFFNAAIDTGMGDFTVTPTFQLAIPADTYAGAYSSTVTITIASAP